MTTGTGKWCANGTMTFRSEDTDWHAESGEFGKVKCLKCDRLIRVTVDGDIAKHVWQPKDPNVKPGDTSTNSQANRAMRAFERTRK